MKQLYIFSTLLLFLMPGCGPIKVADYSGFTAIGPAGMPTGWEYEFFPEEADSLLDLSIPYDVIVAVRYTNRCASRSVILNIEEFSLNQEHPDSTISDIHLFDEEGQPLGQGNYGIFEVTDTIRKAYRVPEGYTLSVSTPLPSSATVGIRAIGLILSDSRRDNNLFP